ncbi:MAG: non-homologous end-joining DNA ligase, partial [Acidobacteriota bacterium]
GRGRSGFGALELAVYDGGKMVYCGRVGTGFNQKLIDSLHSRLSEIVRPDPPCSGRLPSPQGVHWVEPELACRVRFSQWTRGGNLRQPVFEELLEDGEPRRCIRQYEHEPEPALPQSPQPRQVKISRPAKVFWPEQGITKGDLADYYQAVSPWLLPFLKDRLLVLTRYPDGIEGKFFFQKDAPDYVPDWLRTERLWSENAHREVDYFVCDDLESLLYLINLGTIPLHIWSSRASNLGRPDWSIIDLDPKGAPFPDVVRLALGFRSLCQKLELPCYCKTSGSSGLHVLIPLGRQCTYEQSRNLAELLARVVALDHPQVATLFRSIKKREGKVYLDTGQNGHGKLLVAPYSVRPLPGAPVSAPLHWDEVDEKLEPQQFTLRDVPKRLQKMKADPWQGLLGDRPDLRRVIERLAERIRPGK